MKKCTGKNVDELFERLLGHIVCPAAWAEAVPSALLARCGAEDLKELCRSHGVAGFSTRQKADVVALLAARALTYNDLTNDQLKGLCKAGGLAVGGDKAKLIERLAGAAAGAAAEAGAGQQQMPQQQQRPPLRLLPRLLLLPRLQLHRRRRRRRRSSSSRATCWWRMTCAPRAMPCSRRCAGRRASRASPTL